MFLFLKHGIIEAYTDILAFSRSVVGIGIEKTKFQLYLTYVVKESLDVCFYNVAISAKLQFES